jgi:hypothetical protein
LQQSPGFSSAGVHEGFVVDGVALDRLFLKHRSFSTIRGWYNTRYSALFQSCNRKRKEKYVKYYSQIFVPEKKYSD